MKFVDKVKINVSGGHGGAGAVGFRREKYVPKGGPDGGDGGDGGNVIVLASSKPQTLMDLSMQRTYRAENGQSGGPKKMYGSRGKDSILNVPIGTMVFDEENKLLADLCDENARFVAAKGGLGGQGNARFATSVNQAPRYAQSGLPGESRTITLELRLIAEVGLVGLPNAGKSTLLKALTRANPKIAAYPFTTLYPNLGVLRFYDQEIVVADIPGLIEGASEGHGLGFEFLRHISRTKLLVHVIDASADLSEIFENYRTVSHELESSPHELKNKASIVALNKIDIMEKSILDETMSQFRQHRIEPIPVSAATGEGMTELIRSIQKEYGKKSDEK